ncbi:hypothetical protein MLD38_040387 [Melastoma candidum]|uniref:Uncharacterized protein n=1 Tax=Melastoma candidum TaxID=119954 RepID=A0ACB9L544_9MYRT|nr:hypothetical protein MLD38_040387 [Melastoma candidum]
MNPLKHDTFMRVRKNGFLTFPYYAGGINRREDPFRPVPFPARPHQLLLPPSRPLSSPFLHPHPPLHPGTIFFSGFSKSGFVARKISTTLVSLDVPSSFPSPLDALHGDIGALSSRNVLVLLSKSGSSEELLCLAPFDGDRGAMLVSITSSQGSLLDQYCDLSVFLPLKRELCPFNLSPVTSAAIRMVFGDTVIVALMRARNLIKEVYATNHPTGRINKSLVFKISPFYPCLNLLAFKSD